MTDYAFIQQRRKQRPHPDYDPVADLDERTRRLDMSCRNGAIVCIKLDGKWCDKNHRVPLPDTPNGRECS